MAKQLFSNFKRSALAADITNVATSLTLTTGDGASFQSPTGGDYEIFVITDGTNYEIIKCTTRSTDTLSVIVRAQEGTTARAWTEGASIYSDITKAFIDKLPQIAFDSGGNALGTNAINLQTGRANVANVASGNNAVAVGYSTTASGSAAVAMGNSASATATSAVASGETASATAPLAVAHGYGATSNTENSQALGPLSRTTPPTRANSTAYNWGQTNVIANAAGKLFILDTAGTTASGEPSWNTTNLGDLTTDGTAVWKYIGTPSSPVLCNAIGYMAMTDGYNPVAVGAYSFATDTATACGAYAFAVAYSSVFGNNALGYAEDCCLFGENSNVSAGAGYGAIAIGSWSFVDGSKSHGIAIGADAVNRIGESHVVNGASLVRKDNSEDAAKEHIYFVGQQNYWLSKEIDLKTVLDDAVTITIPTGATLYPDEIGLIVTASSTVTGQPDVSFGVTGNTTALLASTATTKSAVKGRDIFTILSKDGINSFTASVKTGATATTLKGRFYVRGLLLEDE